MSDNQLPNRPTPESGPPGVLFDAGPPRARAAEEPELRGTPRLRQPNREQIEFRACAWNDLLPQNHEARAVWDFVARLDLTPLLTPIKSVEGRPGTPPLDPRILTALWLYAVVRGVGSARELARRCGERGEIPFQWICGGVSVNHHTLSDFRVAHVDFLDPLLTHSTATLLQQELVDLDTTAQDGMRVRASAGAASFRRRESLQECLKEADAQVQSLKQELEGDWPRPVAASRRLASVPRKNAGSALKPLWTACRRRKRRRRKATSPKPASARPIPRRRS